jgi:hypothetical protein
MLTLFPVSVQLSRSLVELLSQLQRRDWASEASISFLNRERFDPSDTASFLSPGIPKSVTALRKRLWKPAVTMFDEG